MTSIHNSLCYQGIQRIYRNTVVQHIRKGMITAFGETALDKLREPFKSEEWTRIKSDAQLARATGELDASIQDDFDVLSVNHFFNIFDKHWAALMNEAVDEPTARRQKQTVLGWMREIKNLRDPLCHPAEADFTREDSFRLLDCGRRVLSRLGHSEEAIDISDLIDEILGKPHGEDERLPLDDQLPSRESVVVSFIGRDRELAELRQWFDDPASVRWALAGEGGKGKSAIAYTFGCDVKERAPVPFQTVLWLSAKKHRFIEGLSTQVDEPDFCDLETALEQILNQLGWTEDVDLPIESRKARVLELLTDLPALVIVDDVDSLDVVNEDAIEFFSFHVPKTRSKILFTSRRTLFGMGGSTTHVSGFAEDDAKAFIHSRCELMGLDPSAFTEPLVREIVTVTEGSPLYIEDLLRLSISARSPGAALTTWREKEGLEARRYALERECELLTQQARDVLMVGCVAKGSVSFSELSNVAGLADENVSAALQELRRLFLVPAPEFVEGEQRFKLNVNTRTLVQEVYGRTDQWRRVQAAYQAITKGLPPGGRSKIGAIIRQCGLLFRSGRPEEAERHMRNALTERPGDPDLYGFSGWLYKYWQPPRIADARRQFERAAQLKCIKEDMYEHWSRMESREYEWSRAATAAEKGLKLMPDSAVLSYWAGKARSQLSKELLGGLHHERASKEGKTARAHLEHALANVRLDDRVSRADIYRTLVLLCETLTDIGGIRHFLRLWKRDVPNQNTLDWETQRLQDKFRTTFSPGKEDD